VREEERIKAEADKLKTAKKLFEMGLTQAQVLEAVELEETMIESIRKSCEKLENH